jgi:sigma-B regulation protein RsbU (phosphoserine phosphatase)
MSLIHQHLVSPDSESLLVYDHHCMAEVETQIRASCKGVEGFLLDLADALNSTLELDLLLRRVADLVREVIDYKIFAILLLNQQRQDLYFRFQIGHAPEIERIRVKVGSGVVGTAAQERRIVLVPDITTFENYISAREDVKSELAVPLITKDRVVGIIDIQSDQLNYFNEEHARLLNLVASRVAVTIENARLYTRLSRQAETLMVLHEISRELTSILNLDQLLRRITDLLLRVIDYHMFSILLLDDKSNKLTHRFSLRFNENVHLKHDIPVGRGLVGYAAEQAEAVLAPDVHKDPRYIEVNPETRSELCVPLIYKERVIGVLDLEHTRRGYFNEDHQRTITTLAGQIAIAIENARLYERLQEEEARLERDLAMAREVQVSLLPSEVPKIARAELGVRFQSAYAIGGDMYDFVEYSPTQTAISLSDVSGKGSPAALYAALASGLFRSAAQDKLAPAEMLQTLNKSLHERGVETQFCSMVFAHWDADKSELRIANSGSPRPIFCRDGKTEKVHATGIPLGMFDYASYDEVTLQIQPGDVVVLFSDGMVDALNAAGELFGRTRLEQLVIANRHLPASDLVASLFSAVQQHSGEVAAFDDETVIVFKAQ